MTPIDLYAAHVHDGVSMRSLAKQLGTHTSTVQRRIRRIEYARDNPLIDIAADHPPTTKDAAAGDALAAQFGKLPGVDMVVDSQADRAMVVREDAVLWSGARGPILALAVARKVSSPQRLGGLIKAQFKGAPKPVPVSKLVAPVTAAATPGKTIAQVAREVGATRTRVSRLIAKHGLPARDPADKPYHGVETVIEGMSDADAKEYLLEAYRQLAGVSPDREIEARARYGVTQRVAKIAAALEHARGELVPVERLSAIMRHAGLAGGDEGVKIAICSLRKAIAARNLPVEIVTVYSGGYALRPVEGGPV